ncbi:hypothetical protein ACU686_16035 [Yinghuangia aomiensis]
MGNASVWAPRKVAAAVTWTASDGTTRTAKAEVSSEGRLGEATTIWLDPAGNPTTQPPTRGAVLAEGVSLGSWPSSEEPACCWCCTVPRRPPSRARVRRSGTRNGARTARSWGQTA